MCSDGEHYKILNPNGSYTLLETDSGTGSDSNSIPVISIKDWNLNPTLCSVKTFAQCNVAIMYGVQIRV